MNRQRYLEVIEPALQIVAKKHEDYGVATVGLNAYFPFGSKSYVQMLHVKTQRLVALASNDQKPNFESMQDTLYDMINYAVFMLDALESGDIK